ncbi:MAG: flagellin FliC [Betaproteobacteria bacterium]|nr:flagellin FliC [Betaproteobacteria bacterium]
MGLRIQTNVQSINAQRQLGLSTQRLNAHMEKLSSGYRINKAADDAAGLAISENLRTEVRGLQQARRNAQDGISLVQTAEGSLNEITNILSRLRELSVQSASDTIGPVERGFLQKEFSALKNEIDRVANSADFNGTKLLVGDNQLPEELQRNGNIPPLEIQVGSDWNPLTDGRDVQNPTNIIRIDLQDLNAMTDGPNSLNIGSAESPDGTRVDTKEMAQLSMERLDDALERVNSYRATLGSVQNRLQSSVNNLGIRIENLDAAKSRIKDADFAEESAGMTQQQILQQAGVAVLSQSNQLPQLALKLLS